MARALLVNQRIRLPDAPSPRANSKPRPRYGIVLESPWRMPGYVLVQKPEGGSWWVPEKLCRPVDDVGGD